MESALISIVSVALVIIAAVTMMMNSFSSASTIADSWKEMEQRAENIRRTEITAVPPENYGGGTIELMVKNEGQTVLGDFNRWDLFARYQTGGISYIGYTDSAVPGNNQWTVEGIYFSDNTSMPEIFDPNLLNPGEAAKLYIKLDPEIGPGESGLITTAAFNGVTSQCLVSQP